MFLFASDNIVYIPPVGFFLEVIEDILYTAGFVLIPVEVISLYVHICARGILIYLANVAS